MIKPQKESVASLVMFLALSIVIAYGGCFSVVSRTVNKNESRLDDGNHARNMSILRHYNHQLGSLAEAINDLAKALKGLR